MRKGCMNRIRCETFPCGDAAAGMLKAVEDVNGGLTDTAGGEQVFYYMAAVQQRALLCVKGGNRFKAAIGEPYSPGGKTGGVGSLGKVLGKPAEHLTIEAFPESS